MFGLHTLRLSRETMVRLLADAVMVSTALVVSIMIDFLWVAVVDNPAVPHQVLAASLLQNNLHSVLVLVLISLSVYAWSGFYSSGRDYRRGSKAKLIARAVTVSYLLFVVLDFVFPETFELPPATLLLAWCLTQVFMAVVRLWPAGWTAIRKIEQRLYHSDVVERKFKNVLVIGGAGYIGSALLPKLLDKGYHVRLLDLLLFGTEPIADLIGRPELEIVQADFRQVEKVVDAVRDIDAIIHLGAIVGDPACALDEELTIEINLIATRMIAEVAKGSGVQRLIFASTCSVYGASDQMLDEHSALNPVSLYARSKIASEKVLRKMADDVFTPVILRFGTIYGLSGRTRFDLVINLLTAKAVVEGQIPILGGDQWRPFVHVDDAALAIFKALEAPRALVYNQIFNVGSDAQNYTIQQIGEIVHRLVPAAELISKGSDTDRRNYRVSFSKIRNILGFSPRRTVEEGVHEVINAIKSGEVKDYREAKFSNVKYLSEESMAGRIHHENNGWVSELLNETMLIQKSVEQTTPAVTKALPAEVMAAKDVNVADQLLPANFGHLLRREPVVIDQTEAAEFLAGTRILVTGAGGCIGRELCRQIAHFGPQEIILLGHGESSIFETALDLRLSFPTLKTHSVLGDIRDEMRINSIIQKCRPDVIFHAAAYQHTYFMEADVEEAITSNVLGTQIALEAAERYDVDRFVLISSVKATDPTNIFGATKRLAEMLVADAARRSQRAYLSVRLGNILDGYTSMISVVGRQIAAGRPFLITHANMRCYFMTIREAVDLTLQAVAVGRGGEVFVLDMGEPIRVLDLIINLVKASGLEPGRDVKIEFTGTQPGQKLDEELFLDIEYYRQTMHSKIFVATNGNTAEAETVARLVNLARQMHAHAVVPHEQPDIRVPVPDLWRTKPAVVGYSAA